MKGKETLLIVIVIVLAYFLTKKSGTAKASTTAIPDATDTTATPVITDVDSNSVLTAVIPGELVPLAGGVNSRYYTRNIAALFGWTEAQYLAGWQAIIGAKNGGIGPGKTSSQLTAAERYAYGYADTYTG